MNVTRLLYLGFRMVQRLVYLSWWCTLKACDTGNLTVHAALGKFPFPVARAGRDVDSPAAECGSVTGRRDTVQ